MKYGLLLMAFCCFLAKDVACLLALLIWASATVHAQDPAYYPVIKPIIQKHCIGCHQPGNVGAMPLTTYEEVSVYGKMIQYVTSIQLMPPWYADPTYRHFSNENILSDEDIRKINDWVNGNLPEGVDTTTMHLSDKKELSPVRQPDLVIPMDKAFEQTGIFLDQYQVFVLPTHLKEDKWIDGIQFVPGNKKIVRYASISIESSNKFDDYDSWDLRPGYYSFGGLGKTPDQSCWFTWSPQQETIFYPPGSAKFLRRGSKLILHIHYGPTGQSQSDSSFVQLFFASKKVDSPILTAPFINPYSLNEDSFFIAAKSIKNFHASYTVPYDIRVLSLTPQANLICRSWQVYAMLPGESNAVNLLKIKEWNYNWKQTYRFESPIYLPKGTVIQTFAHYNNTVNNPHNPSDPPDPVRWGAHSLGELFFVHFEFISSSFSNSSFQFIAPVIVSDNILSVEMNVEKQGEYKFEICNAEGLNCKVAKTNSLTSGRYSIDVPVVDIPEGNYLLRIADELHNVSAEQLFIKMRENGL